MNIDDYDEAFQLWSATEGMSLNDADRRENIDTFLQRNSGLSVVAISDDGKILGTLLCGHDGRRGYFHHLAVNGEYRNKGIGQSLVENCLQRLKEAGIAKCHLFAFTSNLSGIQFWRKLGFATRENLCILSKEIK
jgi:putative acetyltransferase